MNLDIFKIGYVLLWENTGDFFGNLIEDHQIKQGYSIEHAKWVHVDCCLGGPNALRINPPKAKVVDIREYYKGRKFKLMSYRNKDYQQRTRYKIAIWSATNCNKRYDYLGVLKMKLKIIWHNKNKPFCSEGMTEAFQKEHPFFMNGIMPYRVMPAEFSFYGEMETILEDVIK